MPISYQPPIAAVTPVCQVCGSAVYCGGPVCPNGGNLLPMGADGVPQISTAYVSVAVGNPITGQIIPQVG